MEAKSTARAGQDSFLDVLHSEILAGTEILSAWVAHVESRGRIELLFEFESWLRGLISFFDLKNIPMCEQDGSNLVDRNFGGEIQVAGQALQQCEQCAMGLRGLGQDAKVEFEALVETQIYKTSFRDSQMVRVLEQITPVDSLARFIESSIDIKLMMDAVSNKEACDTRLFLSIGRIFQREVRNCRYLGMLIGQRFRLQYDQVDNAVVSSVLRSVPEEHQRRNLALVFLHFFRWLRYLSLVDVALAEDRPLRSYLVFFSLLHDQVDTLCEFLKSRFLRGSVSSAALRSAIETIVSSLRMEAQRVLQRELSGVARESHPSVIYRRVENSHGLLRSCCQCNIVTLVQAFDPSLDSKAIFPSTAENLHKNQKLYKDLLALRQDLRANLDRRSRVDLNGVLDRLTRFQENSMRLLLYQDWSAFESFSESLITAKSQEEIRRLVITFTNFLDTMTQDLAKQSLLQ